MEHENLPAVIDNLDVEVKRIQDMLKVVLQNQEKEPQKEILEYIQIDQRLINSMFYLLQNYFQLFECCNYGAEYIPAWVMIKSNKFFEKQYKRDFNALRKKYRKIKLKEFWKNIFKRKNKKGNL